MLGSTYIRASKVKVKNKIYKFFQIFFSILLFLDRPIFLAELFEKQFFDRCSGKRPIIQVRFNANEYKYA